MDLTQFGWRDVVLLLAAGIGVYVALMLLRLSQVGKRKRAQIDDLHVASTLFAAPAPASAAIGAHETAMPPAAPELPFSFPPPDAAAAAAFAPPVESQPVANFADAFEASRLEQELRQLRAEVAALREELGELQAARRVSPHYADAMALARRGFDARGIAEQCGIALGEAELVMALARGAGELQAENDHVGFEAGNRLHARG
jgi:hypothetical protein